MKLDEILRHAREVGRKTTYPITSADQLVDALGGDQATQRIGNKDHQVAEVRQIPAAYFPIESEADFIAMITRVLVLSGEPVEDQLTGGKLQRGMFQGRLPLLPARLQTFPTFHSPAEFQALSDGNNPLGTHCRQDSCLAS